MNDTRPPKINYITAHNPHTLTGVQKIDYCEILIIYSVLQLMTRAQARLLVFNS